MADSVYQNILVATGGAPHSEVAVMRAVALARQFGATLHVVTVVPQAGNALLNAAAAFPGGETFEAQATADDYARREAHLTQTAAAIRAQGLSVVEHLQPALNPAEAILAVAQSAGIDLVVVGRRHKTAWSAALAGSVSDRVSHASPVDVLVAR